MHLNFYPRSQSQAGNAILEALPLVRALDNVSSTAAITLISRRVENASNPHDCVREIPNYELRTTNYELTFDSGDRFIPSTTGAFQPNSRSADLSCRSPNYVQALMQYYFA
ncbi:MAG: hypothetical protein EBE86_015540 [Hormoscilla sp. GUM202]|nr:hypothetical protein [Hormoscilla sp. GUM202]